MKRSAHGIGTADRCCSFEHALGYGLHVDGSSTCATPSVLRPTVLRALLSPAQMSCGNAPKKRVAWSSSGSDDDTSTRYDVMLRPHAFLAADQCTTTCEPLSFGSDQRSSWSAGCSVKNPLPAESQKPISMAPAAAERIIESI